MSARWFRSGPAAVLLTGLIGLSAAAEPAGPDGGRLTVRRTTLSATEVPGALKRVADGELVRLSAAEFDELTRGPVRPPAAFLVETRYRARYSANGGEPHLIGTAEWAVRHANRKPT